MSLVPEKRVDKNGRLVTRHVRPSSLSNQSFSVPPPHIKIDPSYHPMTTMEQVALYEALTVSSGWIVGSMTHNMELERWRKDIPHVPKRIIDAAVPVLIRHASTRCVVKTVQNLITNRSLAETTDDLCTQIRLAAVESYYEKSVKTFDHSWVRWVALSHVFAETDQDIDEDVPDESQVNKIIALAHVLASASVTGLKESALREAEFKMGLDEHAGLVRITLAHPTRGEDIAAFITERGVADVTLVQEFLNNDAPALLEGIL